MENKISLLLKEYELSPKEIKIYIVLVEDRELTAYTIAKKTGIHRSTTYDVLDRLISKGFVNKVEKNGKALYSALEISEIISKIKDKELILLSLIPEFENLREKISSKVRVLEKESGQKQFNFNLFSLIKEGKITEIHAIGCGPVEHISSQIFLEKLIKEVKKKRIHKKIKYKGIWDERFRDNNLTKLFSGIGENRFLENIPTKVTTVIFGNYVVYLFTINNVPQVIEIQNQLISEEHSAYFNHLWKMAKK